MNSQLFEQILSQLAKMFRGKHFEQRADELSECRPYCPVTRYLQPPLPKRAIITEPTSKERSNSD